MNSAASRFKAITFLVLVFTSACATTSPSPRVDDVSAHEILTADTFETISLDGGSQVADGAQARLQQAVKFYQAKQFLEAGIAFEKLTDSYSSDSKDFAVDLKTAAALSYLSGGGTGDFIRVANELRNLITDRTYTSRETQFILGLNEAISGVAPKTYGRGVDASLVATVKKIGGR